MVVHHQELGREKGDIDRGDGRRRTGDRRQEAGDRRQETGDRRQETGVVRCCCLPLKLISISWVARST